MKKKTILFKGLLLFCSMMFFNTLWCQWHLADTTFQAARDVAFPHPNAAYLTSDMGILYKSTDGGITWAILTDFGPFSSLRSPRFINKDTGFVSANYGIERTFDGGQSWTNIAIGSFYTPASFSVNNQAIFISFQNFSNDTVYVQKSTDYGDSFTTIMERYNPNLNHFLVSFFDASTGYIINPNQLNETYKTVNGGTSFDTIQVLNGPVSLEEKFYFGDDQNGYLYGNMNSQANPTRTWNGGMSYFSLDFDGFGVLPVLDLDFNTSKLFGSTLYGKIYSSQNDGQFWTEQTTPVTNEITSIAFTNEMQGIAISQNQIIYTNNGGVLSVNLPSSTLEVKLYPNPISTFLIVELNEKANYKIFNINGQIIKNGLFFTGKNTLSVEGLKPGIYLLFLESSGFETVKKISVL